MTVINTNVKALYTQSALKISDRQRTTAMAQLSTGKRINSAKDDAAGLAIVGRMAQHIKSLNQAVRNAGDAISLIQTTEGATNEITTILQRMSELALQSSSATYSPDQRGYMDLEFQQLKQEIVHISDTTTWNDFSVLNGTAGAPVGTPPKKVTSEGGFTAYGGTAPAAMRRGDLIINGTVIDASASNSAIDKVAAINAATPDTHVTAVANSNVMSGSAMDGASVLPGGCVSINGFVTAAIETYSTGSADSRTAVVRAINAISASTGVVATDSGSDSQGVALAAADGRNITVGFTLYHEASAAAFANAAGLKEGLQCGTYSLANGSEQTIAVTNAAGGAARSGLSAGSYEGVVGVLPPPHVGRLSFQVGGSSDQVITIDLADFGKNGTITGGLTADVGQSAPAVNINSVESANVVLDKVNVALDHVSATRATMGAIMNRLEHAIDNLNNVSVNTEASRSRIEDADYAAASTELARTQIMQQAATAVLAQANTDQQTVLKLLQ